MRADTLERQSALKEKKPKSTFVYHHHVGAWAEGTITKPGNNPSPKKPTLPCPNLGPPDQRTLGELL